MNCVNEIAAEMKTFLERTPPQIAYHISREGIYLTGGSTRLPYIDNYLASYTGFSFRLSELYETSSVGGLEKIIRNRELEKWAQPVKPVSYTHLVREVFMKENQPAKKKKKPVDPSRSLIVIGGGAAGLRCV